MAFSQVLHCCCWLGSRETRNPATSLSQLLCGSEPSPFLKRERPSPVLGLQTLHCCILHNVGSAQVSNSARNESWCWVIDQFTSPKMVMTSIHNLLLSVAALLYRPTPITLDRSLLDECINCSKISTFFQNYLRHEEVKQDMFGFALCFAAKMVDLGQFSTPLSATIAPSPPPFLPSVCLPRWRWTNIPDICHFYLHSHIFRPENFTLKSAWIRDKNCLATKQR